MKYEEKTFSFILHNSSFILPPMASDTSKTFHDINNCLGTLVINVEVVADNPRIDAAAREAATAALKEVGRLEELVRKLREEIPR